MYFLKEKEEGPIPTGLNSWPLKLVKHLANTTRVPDYFLLLKKLILKIRSADHKKACNIMEDTRGSLMILSGSCISQMAFGSKYLLQAFR